MQAGVAWLGSARLGIGAATAEIAGEEQKRAVSFEIYAKPGNQTCVQSGGGRVPTTTNISRQTRLLERRLTFGAR